MRRRAVADRARGDGLLERCRFPGPGTKLTCAVSGGADSLALLLLAVEAGCEVTAVHVDHCLREASAREADVVRLVATEVGAAFRSERAEVRPGPNLEARARAARFGVLPADVATGHTADDQAETVLLNLLRGAGTDGLAAMRTGPRHPLLGIRRAEAAALCSDQGLEPVVDPSNSDPAHLRNRVRHELIPMLSELAGRDVVPLLARQAALLADESELLESLSSEIDPTDTGQLREAPVALARRSLRAWLRGGGGYPPDSAAVERVLAVVRLEAHACDIGGGTRVRRSARKLYLERRSVEGAGEASPGAVAGRSGGASRPPPAVGSRLVAGQGTRESSVAGHSLNEEADPNLGPVVVDEAPLLARVRGLGEQITEDYAGRPPLLVGVLKGAFVFMSDLARAIRLPVEFDFMAISSYGSATKTSGVVRIVKDLDADLAGRHVLVVEDIVDSGLTLSYLRRNLLARGPASLEICALLVKEGLQRTPLDLRYVGFRIPPEFVVGYGLDVEERYRNLTRICTYVGDFRGRSI